MIMKDSRKAARELWTLRGFESSFLWLERCLLMIGFMDNVQIFYNIKVQRENVRHAALITILTFNTMYLLIMARRLRLVSDYIPFLHPHDHLEPSPFKFMKIHEMYWFYTERVLIIISLLPYLDAGLADFRLAAQLCLALSTVTLYYLHGPHEFSVIDSEIGNLDGRENTDPFDDRNKAILVKFAYSSKAARKLWALRMMEAGVFWAERVLLMWALIHNINKILQPDFIINKLWENISHVWLCSLLFSNACHLFIFACRLCLVPGYVPIVRPEDHLDPRPCKLKKIHEMLFFYIERLVMLISLSPYLGASRRALGFGFAAQLSLALTTGMTLYAPPKVVKSEGETDTSDDHKKVAMVNDGFSEEDKGMGKNTANKFEEIIVKPLKVVTEKLSNSVIDVNLKQLFEKTIAEQLFNYFAVEGDDEIDDNQHA